MHQTQHDILIFKQTSLTKIETNFMLNNDIENPILANNLWSEAKLGYLLLLGPLRMSNLESWNLIGLNLDGDFLIQWSDWNS